MYTLIHREGDYGIFHTKNPNGWEVIKILKRKKVGNFKGIQMGEIGDEYVPSPSQWGMYGWTALSLEHAYEILERKLNSNL